MWKAIIEVATLVGVVFTILTWQAQQESDLIAATTAANTARIARINASAAERHLETLKILERMLPEVERSRIGIAKLVEMAEREVIETRRQAQSPGGTVYGSRPRTNVEPKRTSERNRPRSTTQTPSWIEEQWQRMLSQ